MVINITDKAIEKTKQFMKEENKDNLYLRVAIAGGGCSGYSYQMAFEEQQDEDDILIETKGIKLLIDEYSMRNLKGSTIDYIDSLMGSGYKINNPNVTSTCQCEHSFSTD